MKYADIQRIKEAGFITPEQQTSIVQHFKLKEEGGRFLAIVSCVGGILVLCGLILLIAANWDDIPRAVKIATGLLLMLGAHGSGWYLRSFTKSYEKVGEALHLIGSGLFLGNIALVGQIYHLSSRPPNAFLLWLLGIAVLPWVLRSKAQFMLVLVAFTCWFCAEVNHVGSLLYLGDQRQLLAYALLGLIVLGAGWLFRGTGSAEFAGPAEKLGLLGFQACFFPLTWSILYREVRHEGQTEWLIPAMALIAAILSTYGASRLEISRVKKLAWIGCLAGAVGLVVSANYLLPHAYFGYHEEWLRWVCTLGFFLFCLVEIQVGIEARSEALINLGVAFIALLIFATYLNLFGSMARTGAMFVTSGVLLIVFGFFLEKKRRTLLLQVKQAV